MGVPGVQSNIMCLKQQYRGRTPDVSGVKFGKLTALEIVARRKSRWVWLCECSCGMFALIVVGELTSRKKTSCGLYGCEPVEVSGKYIPRKYFITEARTGNLSTRSNRHDHPESELSVRQILERRRNEKISSVNVGDMIRYASNRHMCIGGSIGEVVSVDERRGGFVVYNSRQKKRRFVKNFQVRFETNQGESHAKEQGKNHQDAGNVG